LALRVVDGQFFVDHVLRQTGLRGLAGGPFKQSDQPVVGPRPDKTIDEAADGLKAPGVR
jgi:hypothetical protein